MTYLDSGHIESLSPEMFRGRKPYPWISIPEALTEEGFERLRHAMPDVEKFDRMVGVKRGYGQAPHDRYILHYRPGIELPGPWKEFVEELQGEAYQVFAAKDAGSAAVHPDNGVVLRVAGMFRLAALRCAAQARNPHFLLQYGRGLG